MEEMRTTKTDYYLAQIAAEARKGWVANPNGINTKDLILVVKEVDVTEEMKERMSLSKKTYAMALGLKLPDREANGVS